MSKIVDLTSEKESRKFFEDRIADLLREQNIVVITVLDSISNAYLDGYKEGYDQGYNDGLREGFKNFAKSVHNIEKEKRT